MDHNSWYKAWHNYEIMKFANRPYKCWHGFRSCLTPIYRQSKIFKCWEIQNLKLFPILFHLTNLVVVSISLNEPYFAHYTNLSIIQVSHTLLEVHVATNRTTPLLWGLIHIDWTILNKTWWSRMGSVVNFRSYTRSNSFLNVPDRNICQILNID